MFQSSKVGEILKDAARTKTTYLKRFIPRSRPHFITQRTLALARKRAFSMEHQPFTVDISLTSDLTNSQIDEPKAKKLFHSSQSQVATCNNSR
jgi:hypothetical protein